MVEYAVIDITTTVLPTITPPTSVSEATMTKGIRKKRSGTAGTQILPMT